MQRDELLDGQVDLVSQVEILLVLTKIFDNRGGSFFRKCRCTNLAVSRSHKSGYLCMLNCLS